MFKRWWPSDIVDLGERVKLPQFGFDFLHSLLTTLCWKVCELDLGLIGLPGSQKYRWSDYLLTLVRRHFKLGSGSMVAPQIEVYFVAFRCVPTGADWTADRIYKKIKIKISCYYIFVMVNVTVLLNSFKVIYV